MKKVEVKNRIREKELQELVDEDDLEKEIEKKTKEIEKKDTFFVGEEV